MRATNNSRPAEDRPNREPPTRDRCSENRPGGKRAVVEENKRRQKTAYKNQHFTKAGDSHKPRQGNRPTGPREENREAPAEGAPVEEEGGLAPIEVVEPEAPPILLDIVPVRVPSQRQTPNRAAHSLFMRTTFFFALHALMCLAEYIFDSTEISLPNSPIMLWFAYFGALRHLTQYDSIIFLLWLPLCNEYRNFRSCVIRRDFTGLDVAFDCDTIGSLVGVSAIYYMAPGLTRFKCMCTLFVACAYTLYDAFYYSSLAESSVLHRETQSTIYDRYDISSWSYLGGSTSYYNGFISMQLNIILINEFATSSARVKGTSDRMLYAAIEHAKKFHHDDGRVKYQIVVDTVKYATQELIATQLSMTTDGGLAARPLVLPIR